MTSYVRATCAMTVNDAERGSLSWERGAVFPADHWAVRGIHNPQAFESVERLGSRAEEAVEKLTEVRDELAPMNRSGNLHPKDDTRRGNLVNRAANLQADISESIERRAAILRAGTDPRPGGTESVSVERRPDGSSRTQTSPGARTRDLARIVVDRSHRTGELRTAAAEAVEQMLTTGPLPEQNWSARWAIAAGDEHYRTAFAKLAGDPERGHLLWTPEEQRSFQNVRQFQAEQRAMSLNDSAGGYMVPLTLDPAINLTNDGTTNPLRQVARVVRTATSSWTGITSAGATAEWKAEAAEASDGSPDVDEEPIPVHLGDVFLPYSYEIGMDAVNFLAEMQMIMADAADRHMATAYTVGTGTGQPTGIITALAGGSSVVSPTVAEAFSDDDVYKLQQALPPRWRARSRWQANLNVINMLDQFETGNGAKKFPEIGTGSLLRRPLDENSEMDGTWDTAATAANHILLTGDFSQFVIVDRVGTTMEFIPNLVGANRRPTGQRGAILYYRTGSDVLVDNAFRVLNLATTA